MMQANKGRIPPWLLSVLAVLAALAIWWLLSAAGKLNPLFMPSPGRVWEAFVAMWQEGYKGSSLARHLFDSFLRLSSAFGLALATAIPLGLLSGRFRWIRAVIYPFVEFYRPLPPLAYYTMLVLWFGIDNLSKILLLFLAAFAPLYIAVVAGVARVPEDRLLAARSLGASRFQLFTQVILPSALPEVFIGLRTSIGIMYTTLVAAEMVAAVSGIGWMVLDASKFLRSDIVVAGIILMGLIAVAIDVVLQALERRVIPWHGKE
jgi:taurine transport system permease protein